jgi:hypothetical protein
MATVRARPTTHTTWSHTPPDGQAFRLPRVHSGHVPRVDWRSDARSAAEVATAGAASPTCCHTQPPRTQGLGQALARRVPSSAPRGAASCAAAAAKYAGMAVTQPREEFRLWEYDPPPMHPTEVEIKVCRCCSRREQARRQGTHTAWACACVCVSPRRTHPCATPHSTLQASQHPCSCHPQPCTPLLV